MSMSKLNVLHIIDSLGLGGAEKVLIGAVNGLPEFQHHIVYLQEPDTLAKRLPSSSIVYKLNYKSKFDIIRCILDLRKYIEDNNIQVVHSHLFLSTLIARLACPQNVKLFTTIHSLSSKNYFAESKIAGWLEKLTYNKSHHMIAICDEVFKDYNKCIGIKGPYSVLYNYVEDIYCKKEYRKMNFTDTLRLVAVGNLRKPKNYSFLIEAFKKMPANVSLDIYGSGPLQNELQKGIEKFKLNIRLCGVREDIHNVLPEYDAFIMSSVFEGQPISLLEAMAGGMPAILSDIPVLREVTSNKAIFYSLENTDDLIQKINAILDHQINLDEYAQSNFERVKRIAGKENYMNTLTGLYLKPEIYRVKHPNISLVKVLLPGMPAQAAS
jgi:glycosyltransferase involved in cell wall biosynthesis